VSNKPTSALGPSIHPASKSQDRAGCIVSLLFLHAVIIQRDTATPGGNSSSPITLRTFPPASFSPNALSFSKNPISKVNIYIASNKGSLIGIHSSFSRKKMPHSLDSSSPMIVSSQLPSLFLFTPTPTLAAPASFSLCVNSLANLSISFSLGTRTVSHRILPSLPTLLLRQQLRRLFSSRSRTACEDLRTDDI